MAGCVVKKLLIGKYKCSAKKMNRKKKQTFSEEFLYSSTYM